MAKYLNDTDVLDAALDGIETANMLRIFDTFSTDYATINTNKLAEVSLTGPDFTKADGDTSGRKVTVAAKNAVPVTATGSYNHLALVDTVGSKVLAVTDGTTKAITSGDEVDIPAFDLEVGDPS